ncbi:hypothetical protein SteCoe_16572 [Stentor coeruleus]|uniref:RING-type domain-containing protein n=1 Tax=Stentor coeruleus TaxID=5963 RepID=A0A1R2C0X7_9CILI|nr:hypothetical protein SteCoe_16572 [Stentor coeruleus]
MEAINNTSDYLLKLCFTAKTRSRDFALVYSYLLLSRFLELRQETSLKNKLIEKSYLNQYKYHSSLEILLYYLPYQTLDDIAEKAMLNNGICNFLWMTNITFKDDLDEIVFFKFSKEFDVAIMLYTKTDVKFFNNCSNFKPWIVRILKIEDIYYPCLINEQAYPPESISINTYPYVLPNKAELSNFTVSESEQLFPVFSSAFEKISNFLNKDHCFTLVKSLNNLKKISKTERESAYSIIKSINKGGDCYKHKLACFECGIVHCKDCYLNHPNKSEFICLCGQKPSENFIHNLLASEALENPTVKRNYGGQEVSTEPNIGENDLDSSLKTKSLSQKHTPSLTMTSSESKSITHVDKQTSDIKSSQNSLPKDSKPPPLVIANKTLNETIKKENTLPNKRNMHLSDVNRRQASDLLISSNDTSRKNNYSLSSGCIKSSKEIQRENSFPYQNNLISPDYSKTDNYKSQQIFSCWVCLNNFNVNTVYMMSCQVHYICSNCVMYTGDFCSICNSYFCRKCMHTILLNDCNVMNDGENNYHANCVSRL